MTRLPKSPLPRDESRCLTVGVLAPGHEHGGVRRYGEVIAAGLGQLDGVEVRTVHLAATHPGRRGLREARTIVAALRDVDVVVLPYTRFHTWSPTISRLLQLAVVHLGLRRRTLTVLHDAYEPGAPTHAEWWVLAMVLLASGRVVVHSNADRRRLRRVVGARRARVIPHFVVERTLADHRAMRARFGVAEDRTVVAMLGWLHERKNYMLAVQALALTPQTVELWLIGGADDEMASYRDRLVQEAERSGVLSRITFTGSVSEEELESRLAAVDVGLCPYRRISASGSLSTLLGARIPVIVSDVPFTRELRELAPEVVHTLPDLQPATIAAAIVAQADGHPDPDGFSPILGERSVPATAARYATQLAELAG